MAQRTVMTLIDDLDGSDIAPGDGGTVRFGLDGRAFEIDLREDHAVPLWEALRPYVAAARRVPVKRTRRARTTARN